MINAIKLANHRYDPPTGFQAVPSLLCGVVYLQDRVTLDHFCFAFLKLKINDIIYDFLKNKKYGRKIILYNLSPSEIFTGPLVVV